MAAVEVGRVLLSWDAPRRLLRVDYGPGAAPTGEDARVAWRAIREWVGDAEPYVVLSDLQHARAITPGWRSVWAEELQKDRERARVAAYHLSPVFRTMANLFAKATGSRLRVFSSREEAEAWLGLARAIVV